MIKRAAIYVRVIGLGTRPLETIAFRGLRGDSTPDRRW